MLRRPCALTLLPLLASAQPVPFDIVRARVADMLARVPNYTCVETIERTQRNELCRGCEVIDRLRVEVLFSGKREIVSWPGERQFKLQTVREVVDSGMTVMGHLRGFAEGVFIADKASHTYRGTELYQSRRVYRFDYLVDAANSGFRMRVGDSSSMAGYRGSYLIDAGNQDLRKLDVRVDPMPVSLGMKEMATTIDYTAVPIGGSNFVLPHSTATSAIYSNGIEQRNQTRYSGCREYTASSTIRFGYEEQTAALHARAEIAEPKAGMNTFSNFETQLNSPIDFATMGRRRSH
jgi:hypothetical protein